MQSSPALDKLKTISQIPQRTVPFLEDVLAFLRDIAPLIREVDASVRDSTSKIPFATSRLTNVSQANETAATEILDLSDGIVLRLGKLTNDLKAARQHLQGLVQAEEETMELLRSHLAGREQLLQSLEQLHGIKHTHWTQLQQSLDTNLAAAEEIKAAANKIMLSLQVQDITAQQIAAVNYTIESVRERLRHLVGEVEEPQLSREQALAFTPPTLAADPNARYDLTGEPQANTDALIAAFLNGEVNPAEIAAPTPALHSQSDIDALFINGGDSSPAAPPAVTPHPAPTSTPTAQHEIEALFGSGGGTSAPASQEDIDKLFGGG